MFHVHGIRGHLFTGSLEDLRRNRTVLGISRVRRSPAAIEPTGSSPPSTGLDGEATRQGLAAASAYSQVQAPRQALAAVGVGGVGEVAEVRVAAVRVARAGLGQLVGLL